jgi:hypothetical protein
MPLFGKAAVGQKTGAVRVRPVRDLLSALPAIEARPALVAKLSSGGGLPVQMPDNLDVPQGTPNTGNGNEPRRR